MDIKLLFILSVCLALASCYKVAPAEGDVSTVPVTNNPNAMPGPMKTSPMPSVF